MVTAVKRHRPMWGSDSVLCSEDRGRERKRKNERGVSMYMTKRELQRKPEITACGWAAGQGGKHQPLGAGTGQKPSG